MTKRYTRQGLPSPIPMASLFESCPGNFFRLTSDIAPQFYSTMFNLIATYNIMEPFQSPAHPASRPGCWTYRCAHSLKACAPPLPSAGRGIEH